MSQLGKATMLIVTAVLAAVAVLALLTTLVVVDSYDIPSESMSPTIGRDERIWTRDASGAEIDRGDIILFRTPEPVGIQNQITLVVARAVAVAGDTVDESDGRLVVNGEEVDEPYLAPGITTEDLDRTTLPPETVYVLGDNRVNSTDSRFYGPVPFDNVDERVVRIGGPPPLVLGLIAVALCLPFGVVLLRRVAARVGRRLPPDTA